MRYIFQHFEFDSTSLVLTKKGEAIAIRHNEAKLLALLLVQADKVLSKEDILSEVWQDKVVSEQAVFQNISHLRSLFGAEAIKTFSKRGYQWQLPIELIPEDSNTTENNLHPPTKMHLSRSIQKRSYLVTLFVFMVVIIGGSSVYKANFQNEAKQANNDSVINLAYIPFVHSSNEANIVLEDNERFDFTELTHVKTADFSHSVELTYPALAKNYPYVLTGEIRTYQRIVHLDFMLKGPVGDWQGQLSGTSVDDVSKQLQRHLQQPFIYELLNETLSLELKQAKLSIAHQQMPSDLLNLGKLIDIYIEMEEFERAMVMADKLANSAHQQKSSQQIGNALLFQSKIFTRKELY